MPLVRIKLSPKFRRPVKLRRNFADLSTPLNCLVEPIHGQGKVYAKASKRRATKTSVENTIICEARITLVVATIAEARG